MSNSQEFDECICPRKCTCINPDLTEGGSGEIHGDCPEHGDVEPNLFGCFAKKHWWE